MKLINDKELNKKVEYIAKSNFMAWELAKTSEQKIGVGKNICQDMLKIIHQREKELLKEVTKRIEAYKISGKLPKEEQRINDLLDEIIEDDIKELSNE